MSRFAKSSSAGSSLIAAAALALPHAAMADGAAVAAAAAAAPIDPGQAAGPNRAGTGEQFRLAFADWRAPEIGFEPAVGRVSVSRAADALGRPVYAARRNFGGSGLAVAFSTRKPAVAVARYAGPVPLPSRLPVASVALTSGFGLRRHPILGIYRAHSGVDLAAPIGTPVVAASDGVVSLADWRGGYGLSVALDHGGGVESRYGHMSRLNVFAGARVRKGDVIGFVGSTGLATGPHLHYELRVNGTAVDPLSRR